MTLLDEHNPVDAAPVACANTVVSSALSAESYNPIPLTSEQVRRSLSVADLAIPANNTVEGLSRNEKTAAIRQFRRRQYTKQRSNHNKYKSPHCPPDSIRFDTTEMSRLNFEYGPFTLDACASAYDAVCSNFCSTEKPFTQTSAVGHTVLINPPYDESVLPILQHFEAQRQESPFDTQAIIILPRWNSDLGKSWLPILKKYKRVHSYPAGTYLFHTAISATHDAPMPPTRWIVDVYLADCTVEERQTVAINSLLTTEHFKALNLQSKGKQYIPTHKFNHTNPVSKRNKFTLQLLMIMIYSYLNPFY